MKRVTKNFIKANISLSDSEVMIELYVELANKKRLYNKMVKRNTVYESGSGKRTKYVERTDVIDAVKVLLPNHDYTTGNDAPRGGRLGDYIQLTIAQLKWVYDAENALAWDEANIEESNREIERRKVKVAKKKIQLQRKARFNEDLEGISLTDWVALPYTERHPSPKSIYDLKIESGMSWTEFENSIQEVA